MKPIIRYRIEERLLIFETEPQARTMFEVGGRSQRIHFPKLLWVVNYARVPGGFSYPGVHYNGLSISRMDEEWNSIETRVTPGYWGGFAHGLVCTPHEYDHSIFRSPNEMAKKLISLFFESYNNFLFPNVFDPRMTNSMKLEYLLAAILPDKNESIGETVEEFLK